VLGRSTLLCPTTIRWLLLTADLSSKSLFLSDPTFPTFLKHRRAQDKVELFQYLFSRYSRLGLTKPEDRPIAISGLVDRLAETFEMTATHGVFDRYLHRSLLWHRSGPVRMQRIVYPRDRNVPSWSWMAYTGQIEYMSIDYHQVEWNEAIRLADGALKAQVRRFQFCRMERKDDGTCEIRNQCGSGEKGWLKFDGEDRTTVRTLQSLIIGRNIESGDKRRYYILAVTPVYLDRCRTFRRVGVGSVPQSFISFQDGAADALIF